MRQVPCTPFSRRNLRSRLRLPRDFREHLGGFLETARAAVGSGCVPKPCLKLACLARIPFFHFRPNPGSFPGGVFSTIGPVSRKGSPPESTDRDGTELALLVGFISSFFPFSSLSCYEMTHFRDGKDAETFCPTTTKKR